MKRSRFALLLAGSAGAVPHCLRAQTLTVRLGGIPSDSYGEPYFGLDGGFFSRAGVNVEVTSFGSGAQIATAVVGGALDVGLADPIVIGSAVVRGVGLGYFAGGVEYSTDAPTTQLCVLRAGPIKTPKDLNGQTLGVFSLNSMPLYATREWLRQSGVDTDSVKFVELSPPAMIPAIVRGTIAAGVVNEPLLSSAPSEGVAPFAKVYDACAKFFYISCFFGRRDWLQQNAPVMRKFTQALYDTARWANSHHPDTLKIVAKYTKMEPERIASMTRAVYDTALDPKKLAAPLALALKYQAFDRPLTASDLIVRI